MAPDGSYKTKITSAAFEASKRALTVALSRELCMYSVARVPVGTSDVSTAARWPETQRVAVGHAFV